MCIRDSVWAVAPRLAAGLEVVRRCELADLVGIRRAVNGLPVGQPGSAVFGESADREPAGGRDGAAILSALRGVRSVYHNRHACLLYTSRCV